MIREPMVKRGVGKGDSFLWRGGDVSRLEGLSDAVFGFALTLLVVSLEVPRSFDELVGALGGFIGFAVCCFMIGMIWIRHYVFFRRYGLEDGPTLFLNAVLLFVVLFYVYPLKFFVNVVSSVPSGRPLVVRLADGTTKPMITPEQIPQLFIIYSLGFTAVFVVFAMLYAHAYRRRGDLELNPLEANDTLESILSNSSLAVIGLTSVALAAGTRNPFLAGMTITRFAGTRLIGGAEYAVGAVMGQRRRRLAAEMDAAIASLEEADERGSAERQDDPAGDPVHPA